MKRVLAVSLAAALGFLLAASCSGKPACDVSNCNGCCDSKGVCQSGITQSACGTRGSTCTACSLNETCSASVCTPLSGAGGGAGGGTGGGSNCKSAGASCLTPGECCSNSCTAGTCAAGTGGGAGGGSGGGTGGGAGGQIPVPGNNDNVDWTDP